MKELPENINLPSLVDVDSFLSRGISNKALEALHHELLHLSAALSPPRGGSIHG